MMRKVKADLHIHTVLSPCGDLSMSPSRIIQEAKRKGLEMIAITDHNSTLQVPEVMRLAAEAGILAIGGAEVTTKEELHCLALFETLELLNDFQAWLDRYRLLVPNDVKRFGYQVAVNDREEIVYEEHWLLHAAIDQSLDQLAAEVHSIGGLCIPAHIDRPRFSLISQLGFVPFGLDVDAYEITFKANPDLLRKQHPALIGTCFLHTSDAHYPDQIGTNASELLIEACSFEELRKAIHGQEGRRVVKP